MHGIHQAFGQSRQEFSLSFPSGLNFSLDVTQKKLARFNSLERMKQSPSTRKRNFLRNKIFLQKKNLEKQADPQLVDSQIHSDDIMKKFKCKQCDKEIKCNNTLKTHINEIHSQMLTCDEWDHTAKNAYNMKTTK